MPNLRIPELFRPGVSILAKLPDVTYLQLLEALEQAPSNFVHRRELEDWLSAKVSSISALDLRKVLTTLLSLNRLRFRREESTVQALASDVAVAAPKDIVNFESAEGVDLSERLSALLALNSLNAIAFKAKELQGESERTYCSARVITDLRPVFGANLDEQPVLTIVHTLRLGFHESTSASAHKDVYIALGARDISALIRTLHRAEEKADKLRQLINTSNVKLVDLD